MKSWISNLIHSFSIQLLILQFRKNLLLLAIWLLLGSMASGAMASNLGVKYLFLVPEYMNHVGFMSFFLVGMAYGSFVMTWNMTCYLLDAKYFPFLATLARPFSKFCINNFIIPLSFLIFLITLSIRFQGFYEFRTGVEIVINIGGLLLGCLLMIIIFDQYFKYTNKDILGYLKDRKGSPPNLSSAPSPGAMRSVPDVSKIKARADKIEVRNFISERLKTRLVRGVGHYESSILAAVFRQNHSNAIVAILVALFILIVLGYLVAYPIFRIPAGASSFILGSIIVSILGAINYWFKEWSFTAFVAIIILVNGITSFEFIKHKNRAYGMRYEGTEYPEYTYANLLSQSTGQQRAEDMSRTIEILENWKAKVSDGSDQKPKMVFLCVSGGGLKTATWSTQVLQRADSTLDGKLLDHTAMISGASGGLLGMAYLRELQLLKSQGHDIDIHDRKYIDDISKDLLNPVLFTIVSNDLFIPWASFNIGDKVYRRDRGYVFENQLNENTGGILDKNLSDYRQPEYDATIPMLYITPSIVNDGRRLIISPQGAAYMSVAPIDPDKINDIEIDGIDFGHMFKAQEPDSLRFLTALRMNATYPYILPNVHLPTSPGIEVMDAGFRDNFGIKTATRFIHVFQDWIKENTSGVTLVQVSGVNKFKEVSESNTRGLFSSLFNPLGIATQILTLQEYEHDTNLVFLYDLLGHDMFETIRFTYRPTKENEQASMTFHLTEREKEDIMNAFYLPENQKSLERLRRALE